MTKFSTIYSKLFDSSIRSTNHITFKSMLASIYLSEKNRILTGTQHLYKEMPIRLSQRVRDLNTLPFGLNYNHSVNKVREWYLNSFEEVISFPEPKSIEDCYKYKDVMKQIYHRHSPTLMTMSKGIYELKEEGKLDDIQASTTQTFLNKFYSNRTEIRILMEQYFNYFESDNNSNYCKNDKCGIIHLKCPVPIILKDVVVDIKNICDRNNLEVDLDEIIKIKTEGDLNLPFIENYLYYILFELLKNSVQAIIDKGKNKNYINIFVKEVDESLILIKIKDEGIGIEEKDIEKIWLYTFSSHPIKPKDIIEETEDFSIRSPLSGFGYGLPITKIYLNFFDASIQIISKYREGTTILLFLKRFKY